MRGLKELTRIYFIATFCLPTLYLHADPLNIEPEPFMDSTESSSGLDVESNGWGSDLYDRAQDLPLEGEDRPMLQLPTEDDPLMRTDLENREVQQDAEGVRDIPQLPLEQLPIQENAYDADESL